MLQITIEVFKYLDWCDLKGLRACESKNLNRYVKEVLMRNGI